MGSNHEKVRQGGAYSALCTLGLCLQGAEADLWGGLVGGGRSGHPLRGSEAQSAARGGLGDARRLARYGVGAAPL